MLAVGWGLSEGSNPAVWPAHVASCLREQQPQGGLLSAARGSKVSNMLTALPTVPFMKGDHIIGVRYFLHTLILIRAHVKQVLPPFTETGKMTSLEIHGVSVMAQPVKLPPRLCWHPVGVPTTPLPIQLLANTLGKAAEDGPCTRAPPIHTGDPDGIPDS